MISGVFSFAALILDVLSAPFLALQIIVGLIIGATPVGHFFLPPPSSPPLISPALSLDPLSFPVPGVNGVGLGASLLSALSSIQSIIFGPATAGVLHPVLEVRATYETRMK